MLEKPPTQEIESSYKERFIGKTDTHGFLSIGDFATQVLRRQSKSIAALLDGDEGMSPYYNLGEGLRFIGTSGNYSDMKIHIDDLDTFIGRVRKHYGEN